jgi:hypothetical protein
MRLRRESDKRTLLNFKQIFRPPASLTPFHSQITPVRRSSLCPSSIFPAISQQIGPLMEYPG